MRNILFVITVLLFTGCSTHTQFNNDGICNTVHIKYIYGSQDIIEYQNSLQRNHNIQHISEVSNRLHGTYITSINPNDVGYDISYYDYIDTSYIFMCKFVYKPYITPFDRHKFILSDFKIVDSVGYDASIPMTKDEYNEMMDIITMKAFNELKYNSNE